MLLRAASRASRGSSKGSSREGGLLSRALSTALDHRPEVCFVVGAGDATGSAVASTFIKAGFDVVLSRRSGDKLEGVVAEMNALRAKSRAAGEQGGGRAHALGLDARSEEAVVAAVDKVEREIGPIAVCVHNIGANVRFPASETSERVYRKVGFFAPPPCTCSCALSPFSACTCRQENKGCMPPYSQVCAAVRPGKQRCGRCAL